MHRIQQRRGAIWGRRSVCRHRVRQRTRSCRGARCTADTLLMLRLLLRQRLMLLLLVVNGSGDCGGIRAAHRMLTRMKGIRGYVKRGDGDDGRKRHAQR